MWRDVDSAQIGHMIGRVIGLVFAHRDAAAGLLGFGLEHYLRSAALGSPVGERDRAGHRQPMPVLHGSVAHIAELRLPPGGLAVKTAVGIAGARVRVVLALLSVEIGPAVFVAAAVLGAEALVRGPRLDQRSVHRKNLFAKFWTPPAAVQTATISSANISSETFQIQSCQLVEDKIFSHKKIEIIIREGVTDPESLERLPHTQGYRGGSQEKKVP